MKELTFEELDLFLKDSMSSLYQSSDYAKTMEKQGFKAHAVGLLEGEKLVGAALILVEKKSGFSYGYCPRGFVIDYSNTSLVKLFISKLKKYCHSKNIVAVKLNPLIIKSIDGVEVENYDSIFASLKKMGFYHLGYNDAFESFKPRYEAVLDLTDINDMFGNIKKEYRTKIRGAIDNGVEIHKGTYDDLKNLYLHTSKKYPRDLLYFQFLYYFFSKNNNIDLFYAKFECKKLLDKYRNLYLQQEKICNSLNETLKKDSSPRVINLKMEADNLLGKYHSQLRDANLMVQNHPDGVVIASCLFVKNNDEVYMIMDGYDKNYKSYNAKHLLVWEAMRYYSSRGVKKFNLGGITSSNNSKYEGLNTFKLNFGCKRIEYIGDLELVCYPSKYFLLKNVLPYTSIIRK